jgi:hypothetical protein
MPIYKLYKHTQKIPTNIISVVPFGQEPIQMLYTSLPLSSLPLHLLGGVDIPTYREVHQVVMQPSEIIKSQEMHQVVM